VCVSECTHKSANTKENKLLEQENTIPVYGYQFRQLLELFAEFNSLTDELAVMVGDDEMSARFVSQMNIAENALSDMVFMAYAETDEAI